MAKITITDWKYSQEDSDFCDYGIRINVDGIVIDEYTEIFHGEDAYELLNKLFNALQQEHEIVLNRDHICIEKYPDEGC